MDQEVAKLAIEFLKRGTVQVMEIPAMQAVMSALMVDAGLAAPVAVPEAGVEIGEPEKAVAKK